MKIKTLVLAMLMTFLITPVVQAAQPDKAVQDPPKKTQKTIKGKKVGSGCEYEIKREVRPEEGQTEHLKGEFLSQDTNTCEAILLEEESLSGETLPLTPEVPGEGGVSSIPKTPTKANLTSTLRIGNKTAPTLLLGKMGTPKLMLTSLTWYRSYGWMHTWFTDPVRMKVNEVYTAVDWWWNGSSIYPVGYCGDYRWWLRESGWKEVANQLSCTYYPNQGWIDAKNWTYMQNPNFCWPAPPTNVFFYEHHATGAGTGYFYTYSRVYWDGGCSNMISPHYEWHVGPA